VSHFLEGDAESPSAHPDGTGKAYNAYELYVLDGTKGEKAGFLGDVLFLSDRERPDHFNFTQFNYLLGMDFKSDSLRLQFDREEDLPIDEKGLSYRYWDARASFEFGGGDEQTRSLRGPSVPKLETWEKWLSGRAMVGWFLHNKSFPARSDLSGLAFLRYNARVELSLPEGVFLSGEGDWVTERPHGFNPVELNTSLGVGWRQGPMELAVTQETNKLLDRQGYNRCHLVSLSWLFTSH
jgi:hypothetical protein